MSLVARPASAPAGAGRRIAGAALSLVGRHSITLFAISAIALVPIYVLDYFDGIHGGTYDAMLATHPHAALLPGLPNAATFAKYAISLVLAPLQALAAIAALAQVRARGRTSIVDAYRAAWPRFGAAIGTGFRYSTPLAGGFFLALIGLGLCLLHGPAAAIGIVCVVAGIALFSLAGFAMTLALVHLIVDGRNPGHWFALVRRALSSEALRGPTLAIVALFPTSLACALTLDAAAAFIAARDIHSRIAYEALRLTVMAALSAFGNVATFAYDEELRASGELDAPASGMRA